MNRADIYQLASELQQAKREKERKEFEANELVGHEQPFLYKVIWHTGSLSEGKCSMHGMYWSNFSCPHCRNELNDEARRLNVK